MRYRRALKRFFSHRGERTQFNKIKLDTLLTGIAAFSVITFITVQLITNAVLSPLGHKLQNLNVEKNELIEENRILEQEIAKSDSITVIEIYSKEKFELGTDQERETIFVSNKSVQAFNQ